MIESNSVNGQVSHPSNKKKRRRKLLASRRRRLSMEMLEHRRVLAALSLTSISNVFEEGLSVTATVERDSGTSGDLVVQLVNEAPGRANVPTEVTIPDGFASVDFTIEAIDNMVADGHVPFNVIASAVGHEDGIRDFIVTDNDTPEINLAIAATSISESGTTTATVTRNTLTTNALTVFLSSNDAGELSVPTSVVIPAGQTESAPFTVAGVEDFFADGTQSATIFATVLGFQNDSQTVDVTDDDTALITLEVAAGEVGEGGLATAIVTRNTNLGSALTISLANGDSSEVMIPSFVTIPVGSNFNSFTVVGLDDGIVDGTVPVTLTASATGFLDAVETIDVTDTPFLTLNLSQTTVAEDGSITATVSRNTSATSPLNVSLSGNDGTELGLSDTSITIPAGDSTSAPFSLVGVQDLFVDGTQTVTLSASAAGFIGATESIDVTDADTPQLSLLISASEITEGGFSTFGTITRNTNATNSLTVTLAVNDTSETTQPITVTIPAFALSASFSISAIDDALVDGTQTVTFTASATGHADGSDSLDVRDTPLLLISTSQTAVSEGGTIEATVSRNTDTTLPLDVSLSSLASSELSVPGNVRIEAGETTSAPFLVTGLEDFIVDGNQDVQFIASASGLPTANHFVEVTDVDTAQLELTIFDTEISEDGGTAFATVTRNTDISVPLIVTLTPDDATETIHPATVTIPAFQESINFFIDGFDDGLVDGTQTVTFTATADGHTSSSDSLDVADSLVLLIATSQNSVAEDGTITATVSRSTDTTLPLTVTLISNDNTELAVQPTVTIQAGQTTSESFTLAGIEDFTVDGNQLASFTAMAAGLRDAVHFVDVTDIDVSQLQLIIANGEVAEGGVTQARVIRNTDTTNPLTVTLTPDDSTETTQPVSVMIQAGQTASTLFSISGVDDGVFDGDQIISITASAAGHTSVSEDLIVRDTPMPPLDLVLSGSTIAEDGSVNAVVRREFADPTADLIISIASNDPTETTFSAIATILAGDVESAPFVISGVNDLLADGTQTVTFTASTTGFATDAESLNVTDINVAQLALNIPATIEEGATVTATVSVNFDVTSDLEVFLGSSDFGEIALPNSVIIPAGTLTSGAFTVSVSDDDIVDGTQPVVVQASALGHPLISQIIDVTDNDTPMLSIAIDDTSISESDVTMATVSRNTRANSSITVLLQVDDETEATAPTSIVIPAGQTTSAPFVISGVEDNLLDGSRPANIQAIHADHATALGSILITDSDVPSLVLTIDDDSIDENGGTTTAIVTRNTDTTAALTVDLVSNDLTEATVLASVTIPAGEASSAPFDIVAVDDLIVDATQTVVVTASATDLVSGTDSIDVIDDDVAGLTVVIDDASISENGGTTTATVSRNTDTSNALVVNLFSDDLTEATVIGTVTIAAGQPTSEPFTIVAIDDFDLDGTQTANVNASATGHVDGITSVDVIDDEQAEVTLSIADFFLSEGAGTTAIVSRNSDVSVDLTVDLLSDDTTEATVIASVVIPAGDVSSAPFRIEAVDDLIVDGSQLVGISASALDHVQDVGSVFVGDINVASIAVSIGDLQISENGGTTTATVTRNTASSTELLVSLISSDLGEVNVPATVAIPVGQSSATFTITGVDDDVVDGTQTVSILATALSHLGSSSVIDVSDDDTPNLTLSIVESTIDENGGIAMATVSRNTDLATALGVSVFSDDTTEATVPITIVIPAGQRTSDPFQISAIDDAIVDATQTVSVTVSAVGHADGTETIDVTDDDTPVLGISFSNTAVSENGGTTTATVSRNTDTASELTVTLVGSDAGEATIPTSVVIPAGQLESAPFAITGVDDEIVDGVQAVTITASGTGHGDATGSIDITDDDIPQLFLAIADLSISESGQTTATVTRNTDTSSALFVTLRSGDGGEATLVNSVMIPAGQATSAPFTIQGMDDGVVDGTQAVGIIASANGFIGVTTNIDVTDENTAMLEVIISGAGISENGGASSVVVSRNTDTSAALIVNLVSDNTSEAIVPQTITIPAGESTSDAFTVQGVDDSFVDGTQIVTVTATAADHADASAAIDIFDDDIQTLSLTIVDDTFTETGSTQATVSRNSDTSNELVVTLESSDNGEATVPTTITIPAGSLTSDPFTISGVDDGLVDSNQDVTIRAVAVSFVADSELVEVIDQTPATLGIVLTDTSILENGGTTTATVTSNVVGDVERVVTLISGNTDEATVPTSVTIPAGQMVSDPFTITGIDDAIVDGTQAVSITAMTNSFNDTSVSIDVADDDTPTLTVQFADVSVGESDGATTLTVSRNTDTTDELIVNLATSDPSELITPTTITIPAGETQASVTVDVIDDSIVDGTQVVSVLATANSFAINQGTIDVTDNDVPSLSISVSASEFVESSGPAAATGTVSRNTDTTEDLVVTLESQDTSKATVPIEVTIPAGQTSATFDIAAVDNQIADGTVSLTVTATAIEHQSIATEISVLDDDIANIVITESDDTTIVSEDGTTDTISIALSSEPTADVTITIASSNINEVVVDQATITFTPANWADPQVVTVTGVADNAIDADEVVNVTLSTSSNDAVYANLADTVVEVTNTNVDQAGLVLIQSDGSTEVAEREEGLTESIDTISVSLSSQPTDDVRVEAFSNSEDEFVVLTFPLTFSPANWNIPQTVTLAGVPDLIDDGDQVVPASFLVTSVNDSNYQGLSAEQVDVLVRDIPVNRFSIQAITSDIFVRDLDTDETLQASSVVSGEAVTVTTGSLDDRIEIGVLSPPDVLIVESAAGDDSIQVADFSFASIDGGPGYDVLELTSVPASTDLSQVLDRLTDIEELVLGDSVVLDVDVSDILGDDDAGSLTVRAGANSTVTLDGIWVGEDPAIDSIDPSFVRHRAQQGGATLELINSNVWQNPFNPLDVDRSGEVGPVDVIVLINDLADMGARDLPGLTAGGPVPEYYLDTSGNQLVAPLDAILVINYIAEQSANALGEQIVISDFLQSNLAAADDTTQEELPLQSVSIQQAPAVTAPQSVSSDQIEAIDQVFADTDIGAAEEDATELLDVIELTL